MPELPADLPLEQVLSALQRNRSHLAQVVDERGTIGVIALEDVVEEFVGEVEDATNPLNAPALRLTPDARTAGRRPRQTTGRHPQVAARRTSGRASCRAALQVAQQAQHLEVEPDEPDDEAEGDAPGLALRHARRDHPLGLVEVEDEGHRAEADEGEAEQHRQAECCRRGCRARRRRRTGRRARLSDEHREQADEAVRHDLGEPRGGAQPAALVAEATAPKTATVPTIACTTMPR